MRTDRRIEKDVLGKEVFDRKKKNGDYMKSQLINNACFVCTFSASNCREMRWLASNNFKQQIMHRTLLSKREIYSTFNHICKIILSILAGTKILTITKYCYQGDYEQNITDHLEINKYTLSLLRNLGYQVQNLMPVLSQADIQNLLADIVTCIQELEIRINKLK